MTFIIKKIPEIPEYDDIFKDDEDEDEEEEFDGSGDEVIICVFISSYWNDVLIAEIAYILLWWKPLNVITLGQKESDSISQMITISGLLLIQST